MGSAPTPAERKIVLDRDLQRCVVCGRWLGDGANLHHRLLRSHGTNNRPSNLITVCGSGTTGCHGKIHANPERAREKGHIVPSWEVPADVYVESWRGQLELDDVGGVRRVLEP